MQENINSLLLQGRRHNFGTGGAELEVGRKMCVRLRANF